MIKGSAASSGHALPECGRAMRRWSSVACFLLLGLLTLAPPVQAATPQISDPVITGAAGANGWYVSNVTVTYHVTVSSFNGVACGTVQNLTPQGFDGVFTLTSEGPTGATCTVTGGDGASASSPPLTISIDKTPPTASPVALSRGPDVNGWYNHAVGYTISGTDATSGIASCTTSNYSGPDSSSVTVSGSCTDRAGLTSPTVSTSFKYDATPPSVTPTPARGADANGWYNHPVDVAFKGTDATSGIASCTSGSYSGPDNGSASVTGTCTDQAGNAATASFSLKYDSTPPTVTGAAPSRPPDAGGFYNHAVIVTFAGSDATSGIASCDAPSYDKPDSATAKVNGVCRDNAGNTSAPSTSSFKYDSTPPKLADLTASPQNGAVALAWKPAPDVATRIHRS